MLNAAPPKSFYTPLIYTNIGEFKMAEEKRIGKVTSYFSKVEVAAIELEGPIKLGDKVHFKGATTDFTQKIDSMQIDRKPVEKAGKGASIGIKIKEKVRDGDIVYKA